MLSDVIAGCVIVWAAGSSSGAASDYSLPGRLSFPLITPYPPYPGSSPLGLVSTLVLLVFNQIPANAFWCVSDAELAAFRLSLVVTSHQQSYLSRVSTEMGLTLAGSKRRQGISSHRNKQTAVYADVFFVIGDKWCLKVSACRSHC